MFPSEQDVPKRARCSQASKMFPSDQDVPKRARCSQASKMFPSEQDVPKRARCSHYLRIFQQLGCSHNKKMLGYVEEDSFS
jgi:hypothetical protein